MTKGRGRFVHKLTETSRKELDTAIKAALDGSGINDKLKELQKKEEELKKSKEEAEIIEKEMKEIKQQKDELEKEKKKVELEIEKKQKSDGGNATGAVAQQSGGCYPGSATFVDIHLQRRKMESLKVGDVVQVVNNKEIQFEPVITFIHRQTEVMQEFLEITTLHEKKILKITEDHLLFVEKGGQAAVIPARDVNIGDTLYVTDDQNVVKKDEVQTIGFVWEKGVYAPVTLSGTILVNDVHTSCYFDVLSHEWSHWAMGVARAVYQVSPWMVKWLSNIGQKDGFPGWCRLAHKMLTLME